MFPLKELLNLPLKNCPPMFSHVKTLANKQRIKTNGKNNRQNITSSSYNYSEKQIIVVFSYKIFKTNPFIGFDKRP